MRFIKILIVAAAICSLPILLGAEMYMWTDEDGNKHFSNTQPPVEITANVAEEIPSSGIAEKIPPSGQNNNQQKSNDKKKVKDDYPDCLSRRVCMGVNNKCDSDIQNLIREKEYPFIEVMIKENPSIVNACECEVTPLLASTARGYEKISQLLIENGANVNFKHAKYGFTPLHHAISQRSLDTVKLLIKKGADVNAANFRRIPCWGFSAGSTPLHFAIWFQGPPLSRCYPKSVEIIKLLIKNNANPRAKNKSGDTPLDYAKERGDWEMIEKIYKELGWAVPKL